ncbi:MAG: type I CRISPR-associated protein Cas7 [Bacteroidetes bacterium]|jgi:CRISPR-associated protein Csh2|nr:type I CRISPR-associated protein Cas7 [Bacteroidota bacterium]
MSNIINQKSEVLFLYESTYSIPNGDPFTGEQRYDEETKKILVSDVRIKRFIRDYLEQVEQEPIYVSDKTGAGKTDAKNVLSWIATNRNPNKKTDIGEILKEQIDVRMFGGISTLGDKVKLKVDGKDKEFTNGHVQFTGPIQFALLNPSLNEVNLRMHQNTTHFTSKADNTQGSIGTTTIVPYGLIQIHGWVNPRSAEKTGLTNADKEKMFKALWESVNDINTRSKSNQNSALLMEIIYAQSHNKIYGADRLVKITPKDGKTSEQIRSMEDYDFDFSKLTALQENSKVSEIRYHTYIDRIAQALSSLSKFKPMNFYKNQ